MSESDLDGIRRAALDRIDESRRHAKGLLIAAAIEVSGRARPG